MEPASGLKKDLGVNSMSIFALVLVGISFFVPLVLVLVPLFVAFLIGIISTMRSIKTKRFSVILVSVLATLAPILAFLYIRSQN